MKTYNIFNFDHRYKTPQEIITDSFKIIITAQHCSNLSKLSKNSSYTFTLDHNFTPVVIDNPAEEGEFVITAIVEIDEEKLDKSFLYPEELERGYIYDVTLVLSFLTGRRVYLENEMDRYSNKFYIDGPVTINSLLFRQITISNIKKIADYGLDTQFFNTVQSYSINDLLSLTSYCNSSLDKLFTGWAKQNKKTKFENQKYLNSLRDSAYESVLKSLASKVKVIFLKLLFDSNIENRITEDIKARIRIDTSPSALYKLKEFLKFYSLYPEEDSDENNEKLKWLNRIRNSVAHSGDLPRDNQISWMTRSEITTNITFLMLSIIQWYFAYVILEIKNHRLDETQNEIKNYFITGKFRNKDIFNETYNEYMNRIIDDWTDNHKL
ncbi:hypothetical protein [Desulfopila inferna]|uniref:hypothetical protein n=1 Tax=Desulfopila inferna TaxID=468528 RepID=UPI001965666F|nr:hypothetical protein [Desulfopila inferna]MBM9606254.1 hypothetical protein [Desulfopila inferna]